MTREEFIEVLNAEGYNYILKGGKIVINDKGFHVVLNQLESLPSGVIFNNRGPVYLTRLISIPEGTRFINRGSVYLSRLLKISSSSIFENLGAVYMLDVKQIPPGAVFTNEGGIYLGKKVSILPGVEFNNKGVVRFEEEEYKGDIPEIEGKRILNLMVKQGVFL